MPTTPTSLPWIDIRDSLWETSGADEHAVALAAPVRPRDEFTQLRLSDVVAALSHALDITEGQPDGHAARTCLIGMRVAELIGLDADDRSALFYALQLKDLGCSSNAARVAELFGADDQRTKRDLKTTDWQRLGPSLGYIVRNIAPGGSLRSKVGRFLAIGRAGKHGARTLVRIRCERGAEIARMFALPEPTALAIRGLDEHWNGGGHPDGLRGDAIPLLARIAGLAQTVEVFAAEFGVRSALAMARRRRRRWFDPELVDALCSIGPDDPLWACYANGTEVWRHVARHEPTDRVLLADDDRLDRIALGFAQVVDAKSPWTFRHSEDVADLAVGTARILGTDEVALRTLRRAALLHDIGKLAISNLVLDKPGKLTDDERRTMQTHVAHSERILARVGGFERIAAIAGAHHERLDGKGYHRGLGAAQLDRDVRCLVVADICEAISARRPYRDMVPIERTLAILDQQAGTGVCADALAALRQFVTTTGFRK